MVFEKKFKNVHKVKQYFQKIEKKFADLEKVHSLFPNNITYVDLYGLKSVPNV